MGRRDKRWEKGDLLSRKNPEDDWHKGETKLIPLAARVPMRERMDAVLRLYGNYEGNTRPCVPLACSGAPVFLEVRFLNATRLRCLKC